MALPEVRPALESSVRSSSLDEILAPGFDALRNNSDFLNDSTLPGHFPWGFTGHRNGLFVETTDSEMPWVADYTGAWMTYPYNHQVHAGDHELLENIGMAVLASPTGSEFGSVATASLVQKYRENFPAHRILPYNAGTQATDAAVKWAQALVMMENGLEPKDMQNVAAESAFHGRAGHGILLTRRSPKTDSYQIGSDLRIPDPVIIYDRYGNIEEVLTRKRQEESLSVLETHMKKRNVASFIVEPLIAEGGAMPLIPGFLDQAKMVCMQNHKLLIVDAVQMWGKMGEWVSPEVRRNADAVCIGKYSLICAALLKDPRDLGFDQDFAGKPGKFGATWQGHLSAELATLVRMNTIEKNGMFENGAAMADTFYDGLRELALEEKGIIKPRKFGSYVGFDVSRTDEPSAEARGTLISSLQAEGILLLGAGETSVRFAPRLDAQRWEVDALLNHISDNLAKI